MLAAYDLHAEQRPKEGYDVVHVSIAVKAPFVQVKAMPEKYLWCLTAP